MSPPSRSTTRIDEIADSLYRISTAVGDEVMPGGFTFNQFLLVDEEPLLFHTGLRGIFPAVRDAVASVMPVERLRWVSFSHVEADECGALNEWLAAAPEAQPLCSRLAAVVSVGDLADRPPRALADGERITIGHSTLRWIDAPHVPHGMECGYLFDERTLTLLCGDLFAQPGAEPAPVTESADDVWGPSEALREAFAYAPLRAYDAVFDRLAATEPHLLACMHGSSYRGDGVALLRKLAAALATASASAVRRGES